MHGEKFTSADRKLVIAKLETIQQSKLSSINDSKKLYLDEKGMCYFIFGGKNDWHGIRATIFKELNNYNKEGALVIVKKYQSRMDLCVGSLAMLLQEKSRLIVTQKGDLQFHDLKYIPSSVKKVCRCYLV